ncbi:MAG: molecular chaperone HtpG [Flavobacteriales bacterium]|nr:molecular chaperone HtpG [Flavobacteriales bacterium]
MTGFFRLVSPLMYFCQKNKTMSTTTGKINVQTENIFPIIKKFLYSDHEIFLRELVSNAVDATRKLKTLSSLGEFKGELGDLTVKVSVDKENKTITISDRGIGMSQEEVEKYINQVAFSGAKEFVEKYQDKAQGIIGNFGLGFYSSFMVSKRVEVITKSYRDEAAVKWECEGNPEYSISPSDKADRGTDIILHLADDSEEFADEFRVKEILRKYCKFLPVEIAMGKKKEKITNENGVEEEIERDDILNNPEPAWTKSPSSLKEEDYTSFYHELYPFAEEPLFHIHLNVDYPFNLTGILYFPKLKNNIEVQKNKIQLYSNQVFVTDQVEGVVPEFLMLLHGVIDSPDIPLNVSRSYLQSDANVKKISSHITKKVADKLEEMFKNDRADFEKKWDHIQVFIQYGMLTDEKFYERAQKFALLKNHEGNYYTPAEYTEKIKAIQTDKNNRIVYLYAPSTATHDNYIESAKERGYDVLIIEGPLAPHFISKLESKMENASFVRVDADTMDNLIKKDDQQPSKLSEKEQEELKPVYQELIDASKFTVQFESMSETDVPAMVTQTEFMRRMKEQEALGGGGFYGTLPEMYNLVVNSNHPITSKILKEENPERKKVITRQVVDLALLSQGLLKGKELSDFMKRTADLITKS